jgi:large subunit ribosomal protein L30
MKLKVTQVRSTIRRKGDQLGTIKALGLGKINRSRVHDDNPVIRGMINKVIHLVKFEEIKEPAKKVTPKKAAPKKAAPKKVAPKKAAEKKVEKPATEKTKEAKA